MIKERAMELVAALRSGKYEQTHHRLRIDDGYCCLGVACDISGLGVWKENTDHPIYPGTYYYSIGSEVDGSGLPQQVKRYFGFSTPLGHLGPAGSSLSDMNDEGKDFLEIADYVEANWKEL